MYLSGLFVGHNSSTGHFSYFAEIVGNAFAGRVVRKSTDEKGWGFDGGVSSRVLFIVVSTKASVVVSEVATLLESSIIVLLAERLLNNDSSTELFSAIEF